MFKIQVNYLLQAYKIVFGNFFSIIVLILSFSTHWIFHEAQKHGYLIGYNLYD